MEKEGFYCESYISRVAFRPPQGDLPQDPESYVAMVDNRDAVLLCNKTEPHQHQWPDGYEPLNPRSPSA